MKFRKEYQTYLLIVIAIIIAGYFLKHFFFNKKKKVIEGQEGTTTYYRIDFSSTDLIDTSKLTPAEQDLLKELILTQYDTVLTDDAGIKYVQPGDKYKGLIQLIPDTETDTLLIKDSTGEIIGLKVVALCGNRLEYFKEKAAAAAADTADSAAAAAAAYDYARLILSNEKAYDSVTTMALIAAANLFTIMGQPNITDYTEAVVTTAKNAAKAVGDIANVTMTVDTYARQVALYAAEAAKKAAQAAADAKINTFYVDSEASTAVKYAAQAAAWITKVTFDETTILLNDNYKKVITKQDKAAFTTAAGLIYQSIYEIINKI